jgi:hypothetical protein
MIGVLYLLLFVVVFDEVDYPTYSKAYLMCQLIFKFENNHICSLNYKLFENEKTSL